MVTFKIIYGVKKSNGKIKNIVGALYNTDQT